MIPGRSSRMRRFTLTRRNLQWGLILLLAALGLIFGGLYRYQKFTVLGHSERALLEENLRLSQELHRLELQIHSAQDNLGRLESFAVKLKVLLQMDLQAAPPNLNAPPLSVPTPYSPPNPERQKVLLDRLERRAETLELEFHGDYETLRDRKEFLRALPVRSPAVGYFSSGFGVRTSPLTERIKMHEGLDIANVAGTPIRAPADGEVTFAQIKPGYGKTLILDHGYGIETWYGHLQSFAVKEHTRIKRGTLLARLGSTGLSTGPHVHYEVRVHGYPVDPLTYLLEEPLP